MDKFLDELEKNGGAHDPFETYFQQNQRGGHGGGGRSETIMLRMDQMTQMFSELKDYSPFEWMPFARHQISYLETKLSRVVGASTDDMVRTLFKYGDDEDVESGGGPSFTTIVVDGASHVSEAALAVILAYNRNKTRRVVLTGDLNTSTVVPSSFSRATSDALYVGAKMNTSLFERLVQAASLLATEELVSVHTLPTHHRSRPEVLDVYKWRYGSSMMMTSKSGGVQRKKKNAANAGMRYVSQFVDVIEGHELSCPQGGYQNLEEAEYVVSMYQYLRLLGHSGRSIVILTTYEEQSDLIKDVMNLRCVDSPHFGKSNDVTTIEKYVGRECDIVLLSLVRTTSIPESLESMPDVVSALSRAKLGLYLFGKRERYEECYTLTPVMSRYTAVPSKLCLVGGECHPTSRGANEIPPSEACCEVGGVLHMASIVRMMVGAPLLPGSFVTR
jgi:intron-binding protein aquarius